MNLEKLGSSFWIFLIVTSLRHVGFLSYELHRRRKARPQPVAVLGVTHIAIFRALYLAVWIGTGYALANQPSSAWFAWGMSLLVVGLIIRLVGLRTLGRFYSSYNVIQPNHQLVRRGIYSVVRHPLLFGLILELLGMAMMSKQTWLWIGWVTSTIVLLWWQRREDALLRTVFGRVAEKYQVEVPAMNLVSGLWRKLRSN